jgi:hypothetical protein
MRDFNYNTKESDGVEWIKCGSGELGNANPVMWKQCMCEPKPRFEPRFCAKEGATCM